MQRGDPCNPNNVNINTIDGTYTVEINRCAHVPHTTTNRVLCMCNNGIDLTVEIDYALEGVVGIAAVDGDKTDTGEAGKIREMAYVATKAVTTTETETQTEASTSTETKTETRIETRTRTVTATITDTATITEACPDDVGRKGAVNAGPALVKPNEDRVESSEDKTSQEDKASPKVKAAPKTTEEKPLLEQWDEQDYDEEDEVEGYEDDDNEDEYDEEEEEEEAMDEADEEDEWTDDVMDPVVNVNANNFASLEHSSSRGG
ncbi:hypothetical protein MVEG_09941 [Podila verticillata NRRL 6337]|nr:hypothetical protein MVEG_09941 [Podila verticillata NRRL 6337]